MMMPYLNLSAEIKLRTNDPFNNDDTPFKNSPFAGGNPNEIERNLFAPKRVKVQNKNHYNVDFNHNSRPHENVSYLNREAIHNTSNANMPRVTISANGANNEFQRHNTPLNNNDLDSSELILIRKSSGNLSRFRLTACFSTRFST